MNLFLDDFRDCPDAAMSGQLLYVAGCKVFDQNSDTCSSLRNPFSSTRLLKLLLSFWILLRAQGARGDGKNEKKYRKPRVSRIVLSWRRPLSVLLIMSIDIV